MLPLLAGGMMAAGLIGASSQKMPKMNMSAMDEAYRLIQSQYGQTEQYYGEANTALESQYGNLYGQTMQDTIGALANQGIYESPTSQNVLNRQQKALGETYATAKSQLAGQKMATLGAIDQQRVAYQQSLAQMQYSRALAKQSKKASMFGALGGLGSALLGA